MMTITGCIDLWSPKNKEDEIRYISLRSECQITHIVPVQYKFDFAVKHPLVDSLA